MGLICFGFDLFMGFWGLEVESGTAFGEKKERKNKKKIRVSLSVVLSVWAELKSSSEGLVSIKLN